MKQTTKLHYRAVYFCCTCTVGMENSHLIAAATPAKVSYPYPETNEQENISDAHVNNTILLCSAFHTVSWFLYSSG